MRNHAYNLPIKLHYNGSLLRVVNSIQKYYVFFFSGQLPYVGISLRKQTKASQIEEQLVSAYITQDGR